MTHARAVVVTGLGIVTSQASDVASFARSLRGGVTGVRPIEARDGRPAGVAAMIDDAACEAMLAAGNDSAVADATFKRARRLLRNVPLSTRVTTLAAIEACRNAGLEGDATAGIGLVAGCSNFNQRYVWSNYQAAHRGPHHVDARFALALQDSSLLGTLSDVLGIRGDFCLTVGGASASGNLAIIEGLRAVQSGRCDVCLVTGALTELSPVDLDAFAAIGALAPDGCEARPFDESRTGFVYGQGAAAVVLEMRGHADARRQPARGTIAGAAACLDGNALAHPSVDGEARAMRNALEEARASTGMALRDVSYVNAHGSGSQLGDATELAAIERVFDDEPERVTVNATKALTGHCLTASAVIELIATLLQLEEGFVHPNIHLQRPLPHRVRFAGHEAEEQRMRFALSNAFAFGGINTSIVVAGAEVT